MTTRADLPYSALQAARLAGCTATQLDYWERIGLVAPADGAYSFRDLVALRMIASLLDAGLAPARARKAVRALLDAGEDIAGLRIVTDGDRVWACRDDGQILDALERGQLALFVSVDAFEAEVRAEVRAFDDDKRRFVDQFAPGASPRSSGSSDSNRLAPADALAERHRP
ncbi:MAG TPA: MerR family transcriptional regulator [Acidimicrobiia bacterium]